MNTISNLFVFISLLSLILTSCAQTRQEECSCFLPLVEVTATSRQTTSGDQAPPLTIPISGGTVSVSKALILLSRARLAGPSADRGFSSNLPLVFDLIAPSNSAGGKMQISPVPGDFVGLLFQIEGPGAGVNLSSDPDLLGNSVLLKGEVNVNGGERADFTFTANLNENVEIPFTSPLSVSNENTPSLLIQVDLAKAFGIDLDPAKTAAQEIKDAVMISGGRFDRNLDNGAKPVTLAIEEAIVQSFDLFHDRNNNRIPEPDEDIGNESQMIPTPPGNPD